MVQYNAINFASRTQLLLVFDHQNKRLVNG
jgi:hypothetical protein